MGLSKNQRNVSTTVTLSEIRRLKRAAHRAGYEHLSTYLKNYIKGLATERRTPNRIQKVRKKDDELFLSLPKAWCRANGIVAGNEIQVYYDAETLTLRVRK